jgi:AcrR family transcriptional regulator
MNTDGMRLTRADKQQRTREDVVEAADRLFVDQGFHATSVDQIAQAAGYTKGAIYSNFAAKEDVFFAVYERRVERSLAELQRSLEASSDARAWLESVVSDTSARRGRDDRWMATFFEFWAHVIRRPALRDRFAAIHRRMHAPFVAALERHAGERGVEPAVAPLHIHLAVMAMTFGLTLERLIDPDAVDGDLGTRIAGRILDDVMRGADDVGADRQDGHRRAGPAPRARPGRA